MSAGGRLSWLERSVVAALLSLLVAAAAPSLVQMRRAPRQDELRRVRTRFAEAVGALHAHWLVTGGATDAAELHGTAVEVNRHGWPTLDPRHPAQDSALELYAILTGEPLRRPWTASETPAADAGVAAYLLPGAGGGSFRYDAATGEVQ